VTERNLLIGIVVVLVVGAAIIGGWSKLKENVSLSPSPSPSVDLLFGDKPDPNPETQLQQQAQPTQKAMKQYSKFPGELSPEQLASKKAVIKTAKGTIEFEIYPEATKAASNFIFLANDKFYDGLKFHRVVPGFVIQGGDPAGNGAGGPGYKFADEPVIRNYDKGIVAMANAGPDTNGSQFFIMLEDNPSLPKNYTIFGKVLKGQEVVDKIVVGDIMQSVTIQNLESGI
jgi:peptidyl-prolyl cis-trans isomerase B (cyclophilin B)